MLRVPLQAGRGGMVPVVEDGLWCSYIDAERGLNKGACGGRCRMVERYRKERSRGKQRGFYFSREGNSLRKYRKEK